MSVGERTGGGVIVDDPVYQAGWTVISNLVFDDPDLSLEAKAIYGVMVTELWWGSGEIPDRKFIARRMTMDPRDVSRYIRELDRAGWVAVDGETYHPLRTKRGTGDE